MSTTEELLEDGYPTDATLDRVRAWTGTYGDLFALVREIWRYRDAGFWHEDKHELETVFQISTAGWSGNESLIAALRANRGFWAFTWHSEQRGGHFIFNLSNERATKAVPSVPSESASARITALESQAAQDKARIGELEKAIGEWRMSYSNKAAGFCRATSSGSRSTHRRCPSPAGSP